MEKHKHVCRRCKKVWVCDRPLMCLGDKCRERESCEKETCAMAQHICKLSKKSVCDSCMEKIIWG